MRRSSIVLLAAVAALLLAAPAQAGTYEVRACSVQGAKYPNRSWTFSVPDGTWTTESTCPASKPELWLLMRADTATAAGSVASMTFRPPSGAKIRDFALTRWMYYYNPTRDPNTAPPYILYSFGPTAFMGMGEYDAATRDAINATGHWYGYPSGALDTGAGEVTKATFGRLAGHPDADSLSVSVGCWTTACSLRNDANVHTVLFGARVVVTDSSRPAVRLGAGGLLEGASRGGDEAVTFTATRQRRHPHGGADRRDAGQPRARGRAPGLRLRLLAPPAVRQRQRRHGRAELAAALRHAHAGGPDHRHGRQPADHRTGDDARRRPAQREQREPQRAPARGVHEGPQEAPHRPRRAPPVGLHQPARRRQAADRRRPHPGARAPAAHRRALAPGAAR